MKARVVQRQGKAEQSKERAVKCDFSIKLGRNTFGLRTICICSELTKHIHPEFIHLIYEPGFSGDGFPSQHCQNPLTSSPVHNPARVFIRLCCSCSYLFTWACLHLEICEMYEEPRLSVCLPDCSLSCGLPWNKARVLWGAINAYLVSGCQHRDGYSEELRHCHHSRENSAFRHSFLHALQRTLGGSHWRSILTMSVVITFATMCVIVFPKSLFPFLRFRILGKKGPWTLREKIFVGELTWEKLNLSYLHLVSHQGFLTTSNSSTA